MHPLRVTIPASYRLEKGGWFAITEEMEAFVALDEETLPHVYILTQPGSHYYQSMPRHEGMPTFIGDQI